MIGYRILRIIILTCLIACQPVRVSPTPRPSSTVEGLTQIPPLPTAMLLPYTEHDLAFTATSSPEIPYPIPGVSYPPPYPIEGTPAARPAPNLIITREITATIKRLPEIGQGISAYDFIDINHGWVATGLGWTEHTGKALLTTQSGGQSWQVISNEIGFTKDVDFITQRVGWRIASYGKLQTTTDGGLTWVDVPLGLERDCASRVQFIDTQNGWVIDCRNNLDRTKDGGRTWSSLSRPERTWPIYLEDFYFVNHFHGWSIILRDSSPYQPQEILETQDGGITWQSVFTTTSNLENPSNIHEIAFLENGYGWLTGDGNLYESLNGGINWELLNKRIEPNYLSPGLMSKKLGHILVEGAALMRTQDGGNTWVQIFPPLFPLGEIQFFDATNGIGIGAANDNGTILKTNDGGHTWQTISSLGSLVYISTNLNFQDPQNGWVTAQDCPDPQADCGNFGCYQTSDGGLTWKRYNATDFMSMSHLEPRFYNSTKQFIDSENGWIITDGILSATHDRGITWTNLLAGIEAQQLSLLSKDEGWAVGRKSDPQGLRFQQLLHTENGGRSWEIYNLDDIIIERIRFADPMNGWIRGGEREHVGMKGGYLYGYNHYYITHDGGQTWEQIN